LAQAKPLLQTLSTDPSLRGSLDALSFGLISVQGGMLKLDDLVWPMTRAADTAEEVFSGRFVTLVIALALPASCC
jgi:hypothetical protein